MTTSYVDGQLAQSPPWHGGKWGRRLWAAFGAMKDAYADFARQAVLVRSVRRCPEDALAEHGAELGWAQAPGESTDEYRARLARSWRLASISGTAAGLIEAFAGLGLTNVVVREALDPTWGRYSGTAKQRWFAVVVRHPHPFGTDFAFRYGDGTTYGSGKLYGVNGDPRLLELLRRLVRRMTPSHAHCQEIVVVLAGDITDGTGTASDGNPSAPTSRVAYLIP